MTAIAPSIQGFQFLLLGDLQVKHRGQPVVGVSYTKMRAVLAYLAVEREREHKREVLADLLWGGSNAQTARGNLRRTLADLRRALEVPSGEVLFSTSRDSIRLVANAYVDVLDFTAQAQAHDERILRLYRGEFLAGLSLPDCPDFEHWLQIQRENLHRRALALLERLSNQYESLGDYAKALEFALRYCEWEPWDEEACRRVMLLHAFNGQNKAAIGQFDACCRLLKKELGVLPSEETRQLAERIRQGSVQRRSAPTLAAPQALALPAAQRRQVTVLYCELMPATELDPEEVMELLHAPQARCTALIEQRGGHIVRTHGGGLLAYFGYPQAHEEAARRAVQAALAVSRESFSDVAIRAGVHTGLIITGGDASLPDTSGRTTRIAMQMRHHAAHHQVVISRDTHSIAGGYFECTQQAAQSLPGFEQTIEIFTVQGESGARTRLDAATRLTPLMGRQTEIATLLAHWAQTTRGTRQVVLMRGEAGIGKSRLLHTLKERLVDTPHVTVELRCFPEFSQSPLHPLKATLESLVGFAHGDTVEQKFDRLTGFLEKRFPTWASEAIPLLAQLLSLRLSARYPDPGISSHKQKEQTITVVLAMLRELAVRQPVLLIIEDLHWVDPSTLELLARFIAQEPKGRILAVLTARPAFEQPWNDALTTLLDLGPLGENEVNDLIVSLRQDIARATLRRIVERADGVPLFAEEMVKIASANDQARIPATLHDLLAARMDNLGDAKATAQLAATLGREFDLQVLRKVNPNGAATLASALHALQDAGLIGMLGASACQFKHALIQEAAYESQTYSARKLAHQRIAHVLLDDFPDIVLTRPESVARHLAAGGEVQLSIDYWIKAAQRAALGSAHAEALAHCNTGLQLLATRPPSNERDHLECALRISLGATRIATQGYGSIDASVEYARAADLAEASGNSAALFTALWGMWLGSSSLTRLSDSLTLAEKLLQLAEQSQDTLLLQQAHYAMGNILLWTGRLQQARSHQERGMAIYEPSHHAVMVRELGENICVSTGAQLAWVLWLQGLSDQALAMGERTLVLAREVNHPYSRCYATSHLANLHRWLRQPDAAHHWALETLTQAQQNGFPLWVLSGASFLGWAQAMRGDVGGIAPLQVGVEAVRAAMSSLEAFFLALLGDAHWNLGQPAQALIVVNQALEVMQTKDDRFLESEALRLKGECLLAQAVPDTAAAEACFDQALTISRQQGAKSLELRAATSQARLWHQQGKTAAARQLLDGVYGWFTQGLNTPDLKDARRLLDDLATTRDAAHA